jgi:hypothetical protein
VRKSVELTSVLETFPRERLRLQFNDVFLIELVASPYTRRNSRPMDLVGAAWY